MKDHIDSVSIQKLSDRVFDTYYKWVCKKGLSLDMRSFSIYNYQK